MVLASHRLECLRTPRLTVLVSKNSIFIEILFEHVDGVDTSR
jgi:hypothetical protein